MTSLAATAQESERASGLGKWFDDQIGQRVQVTGWRRLGYHSRTVTGDRDSYDLFEYGGRGLSKFTDFGNLQVQGNKVLGLLDFNLNIQDSRFQDPQADRFSVNVDKGPWKASFGDIQATLGGNPYARFDKSLTGAHVAYKTRQLEAAVVTSEARGEARTVSFQGNNTPGPYFLQSSQIVRGSESIQLDGVPQSFGKDYLIDYDLGSVTFINGSPADGRIVPPTSTIVATYEALGAGGAAGKVEGARVAYEVGKSGRLGVTALRQRAGSSNRSTRRREAFQAFPPGTPYTLQFEPLDIREVEIYVQSGANNDRKVLGRDYRFDADNSAIFYLLFQPPPTATVIAVYTPRSVRTVSQNREVVGLDYRIGLGGRGSLLLHQATGRALGPDGQSGQARGAVLTVPVRGGGTVKGSLTDVAPGFVGIESTGFTRNERTVDLSASLPQGPRWQYDLSYRNGSVSTGTGVQRASSRFSAANASVSFTPIAGGAPWQLGHTRRESKIGANKTELDSTNLGTNLDFGRLRTRIDLSNQFANGPASLNGALTRRRFNIQSADIGLTYDAGRFWSADLSATASRIGAGKDTSLGRDLALGATYRPSDRFSVRLDGLDSDGGRSSLIGFNAGAGLGYDGNGFSNGAGGSAFTGAARRQRASVTANWTAFDSLTLNAGSAFEKSAGGLTSNSETTSLSFGADWSLPIQTTLSGSIDIYRTRFGLGRDVNDTVTSSLFATGGPWGRLSYRAGFTSLLTSGSSAFSQDYFQYEVGLSYQLARRHTLSFGIDNGRGTGTAAQETMNLNLTYQYQIWQSLALNVGYRVIDVRSRDPQITTGSYRSSGLDIELAFNFGRF
ncbi:MAG: hypothetical protein KF884_12095 [Fimbriimonadaceae bacterium]|nr:hypothetical protein [Fimbriimonadaceae bacterium]QYK58284.1 MAG: hypothetical protein KF884_12095 [Fimbriimonadaceae bacterium]